MTLSDRQAIFAQNVAKLLIYMNQQGFKVTLGEAFRTHDQAEIYAHEGKGIVDSQHCKRLAIDLNLLDKEGNYLSDDKAYRQFGEYWESLSYDNRFGGDFKRVDSNHFEMIG